MTDTNAKYTFAQDLDPQVTYFLGSSGKRSRPTKIMRVGEKVYYQPITQKEVPYPDASGNYIWVRWDDNFITCYHSLHTFRVDG